MIRVSPYWFYQLGFHVHPLTELQPGQSIHSLFRTLFAPELAIRRFLDDDTYALRVSLASARRLREELEAVIPFEGEFPADRDLTESEADKIADAAKNFETVLAAELGTSSTYSVTRKLAYDTQILIEEAERILSDEIRSNVTTECIEDLREAGKCIAFEIPTAAGFHIIRATEGVIRQYYAAVVGTLPRVKDRNWGAYIKVLKRKGADPRITGFLDHIRESYRNPITHPEQRLVPEEAQVLLGVCVSAIIQMVNAMQAIRALNSSTPLLSSTLANMLLAGSSVPPE